MGRSSSRIDTPAQALGAAIRGRMAERGVTSVEALADSCGIPAGTLRRYVTGEREQPATVIWRVALALGLRPNELVARADRLLEESHLGTLDTQ